MLKHLLIRRIFCRSALATLALVLGSVALALASSLTLFTAAYDGNTVRVDWEVNSETDVTGFELARKAATESAYTSVSTVVPTGQRRYQYLDTNVFRTTAPASGTPAPAASGPFTYRLTVRSTTGDQSYIATLTGTPSAVQRSWGTIKSMFR